MLNILRNNCVRFFFSSLGNSGCNMNLNLFLHYRVVKNSFEHKIISQFISFPSFSKLPVSKWEQMFPLNVTNFYYFNMLNNKLTLPSEELLWNVKAKQFIIKSWRVWWRLLKFLLFFFFFLRTVCQTLWRSRSVNLPTSPEMFAYLHIFHWVQFMRNSEEVILKMTSKDS